MTNNDKVCILSFSSILLAVKHFFLQAQGCENNNVISEMLSAAAIFCGQLKDRVLTQAITINIDTSSKAIIASTLRALNKLGKA